jgi:hypothetical protein
MADGFFWSERYGHRYCAVVLDRTRLEQTGRSRRRYVREYHADSVRELQKRGHADGWNLGPARRIQANCLSKIHCVGCNL